ncbi:MAG: HAD family phosphatase [Rubripirellula sp.]|nr:HAD family phosphatase [Rubripirellula sp.]
MRIEFVYFDLGNVLLSFDPDLACRNLAELLLVSGDEAKQVVYESGLQHRFESGQVSGDQFAREVCRLLARKPVPDAAVFDAVSDMFEPIPAMRDVLDQVRQTGRGVGLLSNTCQAHWEWIVRQSYPVTAFDFDATILSFEAGSMKPDSLIYEVAERAAAVTAEQILFLDDREENVHGARLRGWQAEQCLGGEQAVQVLNRTGLLEEAL